MKVIIDSKLKILTILTLVYIFIFSVFPQLDIILSALFYNEESNNFPLNSSAITFVIYKTTKFLSISMFCFGSFCFIWDILKSKITILNKLGFIREKIKISTSEGAFLALVYLIAPYFLVHKLMKPLWGRPRPYEINEFSGIEKFHAIYQPEYSSIFESFPSGHSAMAFSLFAIYFVIPKASRGRKGVILMLFAVLGAVNRVVTGGHFFSDVIASSLITLFVIYFLKIFLLDKYK